MAGLRLYYLFLIEYFRTHIPGTIFSILGIALGVALFVSTNLNGRRAEKSLVDLSLGFMKDYSLKVSHSDPEFEIPQEHLRQLFQRFRSVQKIHPRIQKTFSLKNDGLNRGIVYLGIDVLSEKNTLSPGKSNFSEDTQPKNPFLITFFSYGLSKIEEELNIEFRGMNQGFDSIETIDSEGGLFILEDLTRAMDRVQAKGFSYLLLEGKIPENELEEMKVFLEALSPGYLLESPEEIQNRAGSALKSYNLNLLIISMISVLIAFFMVANTMTGIYLSRKKELGILRCIGSTPTQNLFLFLSQGVVLGGIGTVLGIFLGNLFTGLDFFSGDSNMADSFQVKSYRGIPNDILFLSFAIGLFGTILSTLLPSLRSYRTSPLMILREWNRGKEIVFRPLPIFILGVFIISIALPISEIRGEFRLPLFGFLGIGLVVIGSTFLFPLLMQISLILFRKFISYFDSALLEFRIGLEEVAGNPIKNTLTSASLMLAVSLVFTLTLLTDSYKKSISDWTDREFPFSHSVVNRSDIEEGTKKAIPLVLREEISALPEVEELDIFIFQNRITSGERVFFLHCFDMQVLVEREKKKGENTYPENFRDGILISSNLAYLYGYGIGDTLELPTSSGPVNFKILGIREHFFSEGGTILMDESLYRKHFGVTSYNSIRINFFEGKEEEGLKKLSGILSKYESLEILSSEDLKGLYIRGIEKVFRVLDSLKYTAFFIAFISLFSSLLFSLNEKLKMFGVLKTLGANGRQMTTMIFMENSMITILGILVGIGSGFLLGPIVIDVINRNSFGWSLVKAYPYHLIWQFFLLAPFLSGGAILYPAIILKNLSLRQVLSYE
ncbi:MAG: ABC transporter permease [Leptospiraceae bacterium]|nr:ABC transporter permease [Leptospiraceae bacterium]MCP5511822.1 ABC transporter permease [Leptospiraceae bacterium]